MDPTAMLLKAIDGIGSWFRRREGRQADARNKADAVLAAVRHAVIRTRSYMGDVADDTGAQDRSRELELSSAWNEVGMALRRMGGSEQEDLYNRCFAKADFWSDPRRWDQNRATDIDIGLNAVEEAIRNALRERDASA